MNVPPGLRLRPTARPRRRVGLELLPVAHDGVLHDRERGRLLGLNHAARVIWELADGSRTVDEMIREVAEGLEEPPERVGPEVEHGVLALHARGLMGVERAGLEEAETPDAGPPVRVFFRDAQVVVQTPLHEVERDVRRLFAHMTVESAREAAGWVGVAADGSGLHLLPTPNGPSETDRRPVAPRDILSRVKREVLSRFMDAHPDLAWVHAAAVEVGGEAVVLAGDWGSGKSSLATALVSCGAGYLSDDVAPLTGEGETVLPFPVMPLRRETGREPVSRERLARAPRQWVEVAGANVVRRPLRVGRLVFPAWSPDHRTRLTPCAPSEAGVEIARQSLNPGGGGGEVIRVLTALAQRLPAHRLVYHDPAEAAELLLAHL